MPTYKHSVIIDRPIDVVFKNATCLKGCVNWQASVTKTEQIGDDAAQVGLRYKHNIKFMGRAFEAKPIITVYDSLHHFAHKDPDASVAYETFFDFEEVPEGTRFTIRVEVEPAQSFLGRVGLPIFLNAMGRQFDSDTSMLKELLESDVTVHAQ